MKKKSWTKPIHWRDLHRAALVLGVIPSDSKTNNFKLYRFIAQRVKAGKVEHLSRGLYRGLKK
jgi:hypothetical protein